MPYVDDMLPLWEAAKQSMKSTMSQTAIDLWFGELKMVDFSGNVITFTTESESKYSFITQKYLPLMAEKFKEQLGFDVEIHLEFVGEPTNVERIRNQIREQAPAPAPIRRLTRLRLSGISCSFLSFLIIGGRIRGHGRRPVPWE